MTFLHCVWACQCGLSSANSLPLLWLLRSSVAECFVDSSVVAPTQPAPEHGAAKPCLLNPRSFCQRHEMLPTEKKENTKCKQTDGHAHTVSITEVEFVQWFYAYHRCHRDRCPLPSRNHFLYNHHNSQGHLWVSVWGGGGGGFSFKPIHSMNINFPVGANRGPFIYYVIHFWGLRRPPLPM